MVCLQCGLKHFVKRNFDNANLLEYIAPPKIPIKWDSLGTSRHEKIFSAEATKKGYTVLRGGWPDFLIHKGGKICYVEVKGSGDKLRDGQRRMLKMLAKTGIPTYVWKEKGKQNYIWRKINT